MAKKKNKKKNSKKKQVQANKKSSAKKVTSSKKTTGTSKKKAAPNKNKKDTKSAKKDNVSGPKKIDASKKKIVFKEKILLESSPYSYKQYFNRRYGKHTAKYKKPAFKILKVIGWLLGIGILCLVSIFLIFGRDLPDVSKLKGMNFSETTVIYDREGNVLYSIFSEENRKYVPLSYISPNAVNATLSIEDKNFYNHYGFDVPGIIRAQLKNLSEEDIKQGASTITQQLAKNIFLSPERTYERKIKELLLSIQIEWLFDKEEILELYLNKIPYGSNAYGIEAASKTFFGKPSSKLTLAESVILASLPKAPSYFSPHGQNRNELIGYCKTDKDYPIPTTDIGTVTESDTPDSTESVDVEAEGGITEVVDSKVAEVTPPEFGPVIEENDEPTCTSMSDPMYVQGRKDFVLLRMLEDGYITKAQMHDAWLKTFSLEFIPPVHKIESPHFVFYVKELLEQKYGKELIESGGLEVVTTLDPQMQSLAEEVLAERAEYNRAHFRANNGSLVAMDPKTGQVLAMVGSLNYWDQEIDGQVNVATSFRQPGSSFKPLVYAAAIQNGGIGSGTILGDYRTTFNNNYTPRNSDNKYKGRMTVRNALASSRNIPAIKAFYIAGEEEKLLDFMDKIGITRLREFKNDFNLKAEEREWTFHYGPAMAIGSGEVSLLELVGGYSTVANNGMHMPVNPILEIRNRDGELIEKYEDKGEQVMDPQSAYVINSILSDVWARPGGSWRYGITIPDHTVAAKTGTSNKKIGKTNYPNNLLTIGYTPSVAVGVWVGNSDGSHLGWSAWGLTGAAPIWKSYMQQLLQDKEDEPFPEPEGLIWKGKEVFPSFMNTENYDKLFKSAKKSTEEEEEEKEKQAKLPPPSDFVGERIKTPEPAPEPKPEPLPPPIKPATSEITYGF